MIAKLKINDLFPFGKCLGIYREQEYPFGTKEYEVSYNIIVDEEVEKSLKEIGLDKTIDLLHQSLNQQKVYGLIKLKLLFADNSKNSKKFFSCIGITTNKQIKGFLGFNEREWKIYE